MGTINSLNKAFSYSTKSILDFKPDLLHQQAFECFLCKSIIGSSRLSAECNNITSSDTVRPDKPRHVTQLGTAASRGQDNNGPNCQKIQACNLNSNGCIPRNSKQCYNAEHQAVLKKNIKKNNSRDIYMKEQYPGTPTMSLNAGTGAGLSSIDKAARVAGFTDKQSSSCRYLYY